MKSETNRVYKYREYSPSADSVINNIHLFKAFSFATEAEREAASKMQINPKNVNAMLLTVLTVAVLVAAIVVYFA